MAIPILSKVFRNGIIGLKKICGKRKVRMAKPILLAVVCLVGSILISGCETTKGVAVGVGATAVGVGKDAKTAWDGIKKADEWVKKNLW